MQVTVSDPSVGKIVRCQDVNFRAKGQYDIRPKMERHGTVHGSRTGQDFGSIAK